MRYVLAGMALVFAGAVGAVAWYLSRVLERDVFRVRERNDPLDLEVLKVGEGTITLKPLSVEGAKELRRPGSYGFEFEDGYAQAGPVVDLPDDPWAPVTRAFTPVRGTIASGTRGRMDSFMFERDPSSLGIAWEHVEVPCPGGDYPAWLVGGEPTKWAIFVHGKGARHEEALRMLPVVCGEALTCLVVAYRNDAGCEGKGYYCYGADEWQDLDAAVRFAMERGAKETVLVGYSMGGGIVLSFMRRSSRAHVVRGLILDSPMSELGALVGLRLKERGVPGTLARAGTAMAGRRAGIRASEAGYHGDVLDVPVLVLHGDEDDVIPIGLSERFVEGRENVRFVRIPGAGHVRGWNVDREGYEAAVRAFLRDLSEPRPEGSGGSPPVSGPKV